MNLKPSDKIKSMVMQKNPGLNHRQSRIIVRMMEVKHHIDQGNTKAALECILEFIIRDADNGVVTTLDDLTKLLNTEVMSADNMLARDLINNDQE